MLAHTELKAHSVILIGGIDPAFVCQKKYLINLERVMGKNAQFIYDYHNGNSFGRLAFFIMEDGGIFSSPQYPEISQRVKG